MTVQALHRNLSANALERLPGLINIGRISLLLSLMVFHIAGQSLAQDGDQAMSALRVFTNTGFYAWAVTYAVLIAVAMLFPAWFIQGRIARMPHINAMADITMMVWLMYLAGGVTSGFGILILPFIATSCLLSYGRYPLWYAGYAALLLLLGAYLLTRSPQVLAFSKTTVWLNTMMLVISGYLVALFTAFTARYLAKSYRDYETQARLLDRYRNLTDTAFNHAQEAVVVLDEQCRVQLLNHKAQLYFTRLEVGEETGLFRDVYKHWLRHTARSFEMDTELLNFTVRVRAKPLREDDTALLMLFIRWEREVAQEAMSLKLAALGQLTANLAHEIRNPMSAIRQANGLLIEDEADPMRQRLNEMIEGNIARIDTMLEDISTLNKTHKIQRQNVDLMEFWRDFRQEFLLTQPEAHGKIRLQVKNGRFRVWCDPMHLRQILWNLMNNAWRHSHQDTDAIRVRFFYRGEDEISIIVMDNGDGVAPEHQVRLFEPFFTTSAEGTGLGLYVARELAQVNLGRLEYRAELKGFELILPRTLDE